MTTAGGQHVLSIDVEDWFQVENLRKGIGRESWNTQELRVHRNIDLMLEILAHQSTIATFLFSGGSLSMPRTWYYALQLRDMRSPATGTATNFSTT